MEFYMKRCLPCLIGIIIALSVRPVPAQTNSEALDLTTVLSLFSAHAATEGIRINWTLDRQSPAIFSFRIYRGYASSGHFAVLTDINPRSANGVMDYAFTDTSAIPGVTYYYKLAARGQSAESVFPVVISAAVTSQKMNAANEMSAPVSLLPGDKIELYVRKPGRVQLDIIEPMQRALVNDTLAPGIYEFESAHSDGKSLLRLRHEDGYQTDIQWPLK
jgi:hypothetical protein